MRKWNVATRLYISDKFNEKCQKFLRGDKVDHGRRKKPERAELHHFIGGWFVDGVLGVNRWSILVRRRRSSPEEFVDAEGDHAQALSEKHAPGLKEAVPE